MKAIHWTPKENESQILEKGILITDTWMSCSILTPFENLNRWWLGVLPKDKEYIGIVFELEGNDFPLVHGHWRIGVQIKLDEDLEVLSKKRYNLSEILSANPDSVFENLEELKRAYEQTIVWRIGNTVDDSSQLDEDGIHRADDKKIIASGLKLMQSNPQKAEKNFFDNPDFMEFVFEDYEILLFKNVKPNRIEEVIQADAKFLYHDLMNEIKMHHNKT